jgi:RNA polymerase sigma factor (sigma-70 family)
MTPDRELLRRYIDSQDEAAFTVLVERYLGLVYSIAFRRLGNGEMAKDVAQTVFLDVVRQASALSNYEQLGGWLHKHTGYVCRKALRAEMSRIKREQLYMNDEQQTASGSASELEIAVLDAVDNLKPDDREAIVFRLMEGRSFAEAAALLKCSENAARMRVERALERLRQTLTAKGFATSGLALTTILASTVATVPAGLVPRICTAAKTTAPATFFVSAIGGSYKLALIGAASLFIVSIALLSVARRSLTSSNPEGAGLFGPVENFERIGPIIPRAANALETPQQLQGQALTAEQDPWMPALAPFPEEKREALKVILNKKRFYAAQHAPTPADRPRQLAEERAALEALLTPEEIETYYMSFSDLAYQLRYQTEAFTTTDDEFRQLFRLTFQLHEAFAASKSAEGDQSAHNEALDETYAAGVKKLLGQERYELLQLMQDNTFQGLVSFAKKYGLPVERARQAYAKIEEGMSTALASIRASEKAPRSEIITKAQDETYQNLKAIMGDGATVEFVEAVPRWFNLPN